MTGIRVAERTIEPVMRLEGLEQVRQARLALPVPLWPTPAALSNTIRSGTPPSHSNRSRNARHVHSAFSPGINCTRPTFEYGIKHEMMHPLHHAAQQHVDLAESACASPGCHTSP